MSKIFRRDGFPVHYFNMLEKLHLLKHNQWVLIGIILLNCVKLITRSLPSSFFCFWCPDSRPFYSMPPCVERSEEVTDVHANNCDWVPFEPMLTKLSQCALALFNVLPAFNVSICFTRCFVSEFDLYCEVHQKIF